MLAVGQGQRHDFKCKSFCNRIFDENKGGWELQTNKHFYALTPGRTFYSMIVKPHMFFKINMYTSLDNLKQNKTK